MLVLSASLWRRLLFRTTVIAITGSLGKTTTKELLAAILSSRGATLSTPATTNSVAGVARTILRGRPWHRYIVVEVGTDRPGWIRRSAFITNPDVAVILNVARTHTDRFATLDDTAREKSSLLSGLRRRGVAVLNHDDPRVAAMAGRRQSRVVWYGLGDNAAIRASEISATWPDRLSLTLTQAGATQRIQTQLVGVHWAHSILAAVTAASVCGVSLSQAAAVVEVMPPTVGRMDPRTLSSGAVVLRDDSNSSVDSFRPALEVLRKARAGRKVLAITTVSDSSESWDKRLRRIACEAAAVVDVLVLMGKAKDTRRAAGAAISSGFLPEHLHCFESLRDATEYFRNHLRPGDLVLLRGRNKDHVGRIYLAQENDVRCWRVSCQKMIVCDHCPDLLRVVPGVSDLVPPPQALSHARKIG
jgi:UDP-N-acetylmuramoyl-tripeptide--D-alanyl-D-alanine ligase